MAGGIIPICINDMAFVDIVPKENIFSNQNEYINKIIMFLKNEPLRKKYKVEIRKKAEDYSSITYAKRVLNVYESVLNDNEKNNTLKSRDLKNEEKEMVKKSV